MIHKLIFNIQEFFREARYFFQRGKRGYSNRDLWDISYYLATIIPPMMRDLKENGSGHPTRVGSREKWEEILESIAHGFDKYIEKDENPDTYYKGTPKETKEAFRLLSEYFGSFWD